MRRPSSTWPSIAPSVAARDLRAVGELARLAQVVHDRGAQQQVADPGAGAARTARAPASPRRPCARAARRDRRGGSRRAAPAVEHGARRSSAAQLARRACRQQQLQRVRRPRARGARGSLRARRGRGRPSAGSAPGRPLRPRRARSSAIFSCSCSRKRSTRPRTRTSSPRSKRPASTSASWNARARIVPVGPPARRQVRRARARDLTFLARAREHAVDLLSPSRSVAIRPAASGSAVRRATAVDVLVAEAIAP